MIFFSCIFNSGKILRWKLLTAVTGIVLNVRLTSRRRAPPIRPAGAPGAADAVVVVKGMAALYSCPDRPS